MPELDTLRGLAILMVILYHGLYWKVDLPRYHGVLRVFLTAMWAGRLGSKSFLRSLGIPNYRDFDRIAPPIGLLARRFYVRRALRILPAYLVILAILAAVRYAPISFILLSLLYLSNLTPLFGIPIALPCTMVSRGRGTFLFPVAGFSTAHS